MTAGIFSRYASDRAKRIGTVILKLMKESEADGGVLKPLMPRIKKVAERLRAVTNLNRNVHMAHYNRIIPEVAAAQKSVV